MNPDAVNRGPIITPKFADTDDWSARRPPHATKEVEFETRSMSSVDENARAAPDIALKSPRVTELVGGKRYELVSVGTRSLDRDTDVPVVVVYSYTDDVAIEILVDPKRGEVIDVSITPNLPALSDAEQVRALDIVRRDGRLAETGTDVDNVWAVLKEGTSRGYTIRRGDFDGASDWFSTIDVAVTAYHGSEDLKGALGTAWDDRIATHVNNENIDGSDVVMWYVAHLGHVVHGGDDEWHVCGPLLFPFGF
jgi:hypothetical protein